MNRKIILISLLLFGLIFIGFFLLPRIFNTQKKLSFKKCFELIQESSNEHVYLEFIEDNQILGSKDNSQSGENVSAGSLVGFNNDGNLVLINHYKVNNFPRSEEEHYTLRADGSLIKDEYLLVMNKSERLVPDTSKPVGSINYKSTTCL